MTAIALSYQTVQHKIQSISLPKVNWKMFYVFGILASLMMLVSYVFFVNQLTRGSYLIKQYEKEMSQLIDKTNVLESGADQTGLLNTVMDRAYVLGFEKTNNITYVQILKENSLAKAN